MFAIVVVAPVPVVLTAVVVLALVQEVFAVVVVVSVPVKMQAVFVAVVLILIPAKLQRKKQNQEKIILWLLGHLIKRRKRHIITIEIRDMPIIKLPQ